VELEVFWLFASSHPVLPFTIPGLFLATIMYVAW
jgi:hypothetical protein